MTAPSLAIEKSPHPTSPEARAELLKDPGFGRVFTDHMVRIEYSAEKGWQNARVCPRTSLVLDPATSSIHYGQAIFEGLKAYRRADGSIVSFRPHDHAERLNRTARRMAMPELPVELFVASLDELVRLDRAWVPVEEGRSLYLRPTMIATDPYLGVRPAREYLFFVIASPASSYFKNGVSPVNVWVTRDYVRAAPGGTGAAKVAGNYAASLIAQKEAIDHGCEQVVWLDAVERKYIEELGGMNIFFVVRDGGTTKLVTPALSGTILAGVTRATLLALASEAGMAIEERPVALAEWFERLKDGSLLEAFACGTAAVITPIGTVRSAEGEWKVHGETAGPVAMRLREQILAIQRGDAPDPHRWCHRVV